MLSFVHQCVLEYCHFCLGLSKSEAAYKSCWIFFLLSWIFVWNHLSRLIHMYLPNYILNISYRVEISKWSHMYILTFAIYWQILLVFPLCNVYSTKESQNLILFCRPNVLCMLVAPLCPNLWDLVECSLPSSSVHGILQARILEWVAIFFSRGCSQPRDRTRVSCLAGRSSTNWLTRESQIHVLSAINLKDKQKIFLLLFS